MDSKATRLRDARLGSAIDNACAKLPPGYEIRIVLENGCGWAVLQDPCGNDIEITNDEGLAECIYCAIEMAIEDNKELHGED